MRAIGLIALATALGTACPPEPPPPPTRPPPLATGDLGLRHVTSDGWVIYGDATNAYFAVHVDGGTPQQISPSGTQASSWTGGPILFLSVGSVFSGFVPLSVWTAADGLHAVGDSVNPSTSGRIAAFGTADGQWVVFWHLIDTPSGYSWELVAAPPSLASQTVLASGSCTDAQASAGTCGHGFADLWANRLVAWYWTPGGAELASWTVGAWTSKTIVASPFTPDNRSLSLNGTGEYVLLNSSGKVSSVISTAGGGSFYDLGLTRGTQFSPDGQFILYVINGVLYRTSLSAPSPVMLIASDVGGISSISPDSTWMVAALGYPYGPYRFSLLPASGAGPVTPLTTTGTSSFYSTFFTSDGSRIVFTEPDGGASTGQLRSRPASGGADLPLADGVGEIECLEGSLIAFTNNFRPDPNTVTGQVADLSVVDASDPSTRRLLFSGVDPWEVQVVYGMPNLLVVGAPTPATDGGTEVGIYAVPAD